MGSIYSIPHLPLSLIFDSASPAEWFVLAVVIMIVVGPKRLPEIARKLGHTMEMFRRAAEEFKSQIMTMDQEPPPSHPETTMTSENQNDPDLSGYQHYPDEATYPGHDEALDGGVPISSSDPAEHVHDEPSVAETGSVATAESTPAPAGQFAQTQDVPLDHDADGRGKE